METGPSNRLYFLRCSASRVYVGSYAEGLAPSFDTAAAMLEPDRTDFGGAMVWIQSYSPAFENYQTAFRRIRLGFGFHSLLRHLFHL